MSRGIDVLSNGALGISTVDSPTYKNRNSIRESEFGPSQKGSPFRVGKKISASSPVHIAISSPSIPQQTSKFPIRIPVDKAVPKKNYLPNSKASKSNRSHHEASKSTVSAPRKHSIPRAETQNSNRNREQYKSKRPKMSSAGGERPPEKINYSSNAVMNDPKYKLNISKSIDISSQSIDLGQMIEAIVNQKIEEYKVSVGHKGGDESRAQVTQNSNRASEPYSPNLNLSYEPDPVIKGKSGNKKIKSAKQSKPIYSSVQKENGQAYYVKQFNPNSHRKNNSHNNPSLSAVSRSTPNMSPSKKMELESKREEIVRKTEELVRENLRKHNQSQKEKENEQRRINKEKKMKEQHLKDYNEAIRHQNKARNHSKRSNSPFKQRLAWGDHRNITFNPKQNKAKSNHSNSINGEENKQNGAVKPRRSSKVRRENIGLSYFNYLENEEQNRLLHNYQKKLEEASKEFDEQKLLKREKSQPQRDKEQIQKFMKKQAKEREREQKLKKEMEEIEKEVKKNKAQFIKQQYNKLPKKSNPVSKSQQLSKRHNPPKKNNFVSVQPKKASKQNQNRFARVIHGNDEPVFKDLNRKRSLSNNRRSHLTEGNYNPLDEGDDFEVLKSNLKRERNIRKAGKHFCWALNRLAYEQAFDALRKQARKPNPYPQNFDLSPMSDLSDVKKNLNEEFPKAERSPEVDEQNDLIDANIRQELFQIIKKQKSNVRYEEKKPEKKKQSNNSSYNASKEEKEALSAYSAYLNALEESKNELEKKYSEYQQTSNNGKKRRELLQLKTTERDVEAQTHQSQELNDENKYPPPKNDINNYPYLRKSKNA